MGLMPSSVHGDAPAVHLPVIRRDEWPATAPCEPTPRWRDARLVVLWPEQMPSEFHLKLTGSGRVEADRVKVHSHSYTIYENGPPSEWPSKVVTRAVVYCTERDASDAWRDAVDFIDAELLAISGQIYYSYHIKLGDRAHTAYVRIVDRIYYGGVVQYDNMLAIVFTDELSGETSTVELDELLYWMSIPRPAN